MKSLSTRFNEMIGEYIIVSKTFSNNKKSVDIKVNPINSQKYLEDIFNANPDLIFNMFYNSGIAGHKYKNVSLERPGVDSILSKFIYCDAILFNGKDKVMFDNEFEYHDLVVHAVRPANEYVQNKTNQTLVLEFKIPKETGESDQRLKRLKTFYN